MACSLQGPPLRRLPRSRNPPAQVAPRTQFNCRLDQPQKGPRLGLQEPRVRCKMDQTQVVYIRPHLQMLSTASKKCPSSQLPATFASQEWQKGNFLFLMLYDVVCSLRSIHTNREGTSVICHALFVSK